jgi:hypothetical protein
MAIDTELQITFSALIFDGDVMHLSSKLQACGERSFEKEIEMESRR